MTQVITFVEIDVPFCSLTYGVAPCQARLQGDGIDAVAVGLDGANDYLTRDAGLTGAADGKLLTLSFWFFATALDGRILQGTTTLAGTTTRVRIEYNGSGQFFVFCSNAAGTTILNVRSSALSQDAWHHVLLSVDLANVANRHLYVDDVSDLTVTTYTNDDIDMTLADWSIGALPNGGTKFEGRLAELWFDDSYLDLSVTANRRKFVTAGIRPVDLGADGSTPTGSAPLIFLSGALAAWPVNKGSGGGFTENGELVEAEFATGTVKCFNSKGTCQDPQNFADAPVTLRFAVASSYLSEAGIRAIPSIEAVSYSPAILSLGENLGQRPSLRVTFRDHRDSDTGPGGDPYLTERSYNPFAQGSFWPKFRARHPFLRGRPLRWKQGVLGDSLAELETRHFVIESFDGPTPDGRFTIIAKDPLKLADGDRAQAPALSAGQLNAGITASDAALTLTPAGVGATGYPVSGYVAIGGKEIVAFLRDASAGNDANALLLLHCDGADASTTVTDSSASARTATVNGNAQIDTAQSVFGGASLLLDGTGDYVTFPDSADWTFGTANFTVDCRIRVGSLAAQRTIWSQQTDANNRQHLFVTTAGALQYDVSSASSTIITLASAGGAVVVDTWYHIALVRNGNDFAIYKDGVSVATVTDASAVPNYTGAFTVGMVATATNPFLGHIDEFRVSNVARWTTAFTPPVAPYQVSADVMAITRAQFNTEAVAHDAGERAQLCLHYSAVDPAEIIADLLENYAAIDGDWIPVANWLVETEAFYRRVMTGLIAEPTSVNTLVSEIIQQAGLVVWWDDLNEQIRLQVLRTIATDAEAFGDSNVMVGTFGLREQPDKRVSQVWTYFGQINPLKGVEDADNFRSTAITVDTEAEANYGSAAIKKIFSRWIPFGGLTVAQRLNAIVLGRFVDAPRHFSFALMRHGTETPELGEGCQLGSWLLQDATGAEIQVPIQITRLNPEPARWVVEAEEMVFVNYDDEDLTTRSIVVDASLNDVDLRDLHDALYGAGIVAGDVVVCTINTGVTVGSTSTATPAFDVGDWPVGVDITLIVNGRIQGRGGDGGDQGMTSGAAGQPGGAGGTALYCRFAIDVEFGAASEIWGGGGGGGGGHVGGGGGGGGGAGTQVGLGGQGGAPMYDGAPGTSEAGGVGPFIGGDGGGPGLVGVASAGSPSAAGGAAGNAIDGLSYLTISDGGADRRGGEIN